MTTYRPTVTLASAMDRERTTLDVLDVDSDDNGNRPALRTHHYHPSARQPPQRYWELVDDNQLTRWWEPVASGLDADVNITRTRPKTYVVRHR